MAVSNQHVKHIHTDREYRSNGLFDSIVEVKIGGFWRKSTRYTANDLADPKIFAKK